MHYDERKDAAVVDRHCTANRNIFSDIAFVLTLAMLAGAALKAILG